MEVNSPDNAEHNGDVYVEIYESFEVQGAFFFGTEPFY